MEDILFEVLVWEQIEGCPGKFMSAPVDAAIARDTMVEAGVVVWIGTSFKWGEQISTCLKSYFSKDGASLSI
jgi:hypothetical protein